MNFQTENQVSYSRSEYYGEDGKEKISLYLQSVKLIRRVKEIATKEDYKTGLLAKYLYIAEFDNGYLFKMLLESAYELESLDSVCKRIKHLEGVKQS